MIDFVIAALPFVIGGIAVAVTAAYAKDFEKWTLSERKRFENSSNEVSKSFESSLIIPSIFLKI